MAENSLHEEMIINTLLISTGDKIPPDLQTGYPQSKRQCQCDSIYSWRGCKENWPGRGRNSVFSPVVIWSQWRKKSCLSNYGQSSVKCFFERERKEPGPLNARLKGVQVTQRTALFSSPRESPARCII